MNLLKKIIQRYKDKVVNEWIEETLMPSRKSSWRKVIYHDGSGFYDIKIIKKRTGYSYPLDPKDMPLLKKK